MLLIKAKVKQKYERELESGGHRVKDCSWLKRIKLFLSRDLKKRQDLIRAFTDLAIPHTQCVCKRHLGSWLKTTKKSLKKIMKGTIIPREAFNLKFDFTDC